MVQEQLISFLLNRHWTVQRDGPAFVVMQPPPAFQLPEGYTLSIPKETGKMDFDIFIKNILEIISDFYHLSADDLDAIIIKEKTIFKVRIYDEDAKDGKLSFLRFDEMIERLKNILTDAASFAIDKKIIATKTPEEAHKYVDLCQILQTEVGSFVTRIQLPSKEIIKDAELFDEGAIYSEEVNKRLSEVMRFVNDEVLQANNEFTDEYLMDNEKFLNLKLLRDIHLFYDKVDLTNIDFSFHNISSSKTIESQNITKEKLYRLFRLVEHLNEQAINTDVIEIKGKVTMLKSTDPNRLKNTVTVGSIYNDREVIAQAHLSREQYRIAIEAHKNKQYVIIRGSAKITKTRIKFFDVQSILVSDN